MPLTFVIAWRFLFSARSDRPLMLFSVVAVFGIAIAVCLFLVVDTLLAGFSHQIRDVLIGFHAPLSYSIPAEFHDKTVLTLKKFSKNPMGQGLKFAAGFEFPALLRDEQSREVTGVKARSVDADFFKIKPEVVKIYWQDGYDETTFVNSPRAILVGEELYRNLPPTTTAGDVVEFVHPFADVGPAGEVEPSSATFEIAGIIATGSYDIDHLYVFLPVDAVRGFANSSLMAYFFLLYPHDPGKALSVKEALTLPPYHLDSGRLTLWSERNQGLTRAMALERVVFLFLFFVIVAISIVNLVSVVILFNLSKRQSMTILKALGMGFSELGAIAAFVGAILSILGALCGVILGGLILLVLRVGGFYLPEAYGMENLPLELRLVTVVFLVGLTPLVGIVVSWWPSMRQIRHTVTQDLGTT